jgi:hypothetical protein
MNNLELIKCPRCGSIEILDVAAILVWCPETGESVDLLQCNDCNRVFSVDSGDYITKEEWTAMSSEEREVYEDYIKERREKEKKNKEEFEQKELEWRGED